MDNKNRRPARDFRDLVVWQKAHQLVLDVYRISQGFPRAEVYGLTAQMRRALRLVSPLNGTTSD